MQEWNWFWCFSHGKSQTNVTSLQCEPQPGNCFQNKMFLLKGEKCKKTKAAQRRRIFFFKSEFLFFGCCFFFAIQVTGRLSIYVMIMKRSRGGCSPAEVWLDFFSFLFWNLHVFHAKLRMDLLAGQTRVCVTWRNPAATFQTLKMKRRKIYRGDPLFLSFFCPFTSFVSLTHTHTRFPLLSFSPPSLLQCKCILSRMQPAARQIA